MRIERWKRKHDHFMDSRGITSHSTDRDTLVVPATPQNVVTRRGVK